LTGAAVMLLVSTVGIVLVITLLTLPASTAGLFAKSLRSMMAGAAVISLATVFFGLMVSYLADLPSGAGIVAVAACFYGVGRITSTLLNWVRRDPPQESAQ